MQSTLQKLNSSYYNLRGRACEFATCAHRDWLQLTYHFPGPLWGLRNKVLILVDQNAEQARSTSRPHKTISQVSVYSILGNG